MNDQLSPELLLLVGIAVVGIMFSIVTASVLLLGYLRKQSSQIASISKQNQSLAEAINPLSTEGKSIDSVITRLSFNESLLPDRFAEVSQKCALIQLNDAIGPNIGDGLSLSVNALRLTSSGAEMTVSLSKDGQRLLSEGKAVIPQHKESRALLPMLRDSRNGRIIEQMKEARAAKAITRLGQVSASAVAMAHIVSGADISKRLAEVDRKVNLLLKYREIDQFAQLKNIYVSAGEVLSFPMNPESRSQLWQLKRELRGLRYVWSSELNHHLESIEDPASRFFLKRWFSRNKTTDGKISEKVSEGELKLNLFEYCLKLEQVLAAETGQYEMFERTLAIDLSDLQKTSDLLRSKAEYLTGDSQVLSVNGTIQKVDAMIEGYSTLVPEAFLKDTNLRVKREVVEQVSNG